MLQSISERSWKEVKEYCKNIVFLIQNSELKEVLWAANRIRNCCFCQHRSWTGEWNDTALNGKVSFRFIFRTWHLLWDSAGRGGWLLPALRSLTRHPNKNPESLGWTELDRQLFRSIELSQTSGVCGTRFEPKENICQPNLIKTPTYCLFDGVVDCHLYVWKCLRCKFKNSLN